MTRSEEGHRVTAPRRSSNALPLRRAAHPQIRRLDQLIRAARSARPDAAKGLLFASRSGHALVNAAFDLFECDQLYSLRQDVEHELGIDPGNCLNLPQGA